MRSPVDNLKNGTFGHINYFKLCVHSEKLEEKTWERKGTLTKRAT